MLERVHPETVALLTDEKDDSLAFTGFPGARCRQIQSTNPLGRLNREIKRWTRVVGVSPHPKALLRLTIAVLVGQPDEWAATNRRYLAEGSLRGITQSEEPEQGVTRRLNIAYGMKSHPPTEPGIAPLHGTSSKIESATGCETPPVAI